MTRVLIIARIRLYGEGLAECLTRRSTFSVVGIASDLSEALSLLEDNQPNVVLYDLSIQEGLEGIKTLSNQHPSIRIVALSVSEIDSEIIACAEAGISGYVPLDATLTHLETAIIGAARGELFCAPHIACELLKEIGRRSSGKTPKRSLTHKLTRREAEILDLLCKGQCNKEIASELYISLSTVKNHIHQILEKLCVRNRSEAVAFACNFNQSINVSEKVSCL
jgi:DNA-binding NarL/FixJ family response regulator